MEYRLIEIRNFLAGPVVQRPEHPVYIRKTWGSSPHVPITFMQYRRALRLTIKRINPWRKIIRNPVDPGPR